MNSQWLEKVLVEIYKVQTTKDKEGICVDDLLSSLSKEFTFGMLDTLVDELSNKNLIVKNNDVIGSFQITELGKSKVKTLL